MDKISKVIDEYYDFIVEYEKYINRSKDFNSELIDKKKKERKIDGNIKEHLSSIFSSRDSDIISYLAVEDFVEDELYDLGYMDLTKYYKNQGLDVKDDNVINKIQEETSELINKEVLDSNIFSEDTLKIHPLARKIEDICSKLWNIYKNIDQEIEMQGGEKDMKDRIVFHKQGEKVNKIFCDFMKEKGFSTWEHDDKDLGFGVIASNSNDKFIPIFELHNWHYPESHSIFVEDRNGNSILTGDTVAIYSMDIDENWTENDILDKFKIMLEDVYSKYGKYDKNNRLDFVFNEMQMERKEFKLEETEISL